MQIVLARDVDVNAVDATGRPPLLVAANAGQEKAYQLLLKYGADESKAKEA